jgi:pilus assembly protein CpaF
MFSKYRKADKPAAARVVELPKSTEASQAVSEKAAPPAPKALAPKRASAMRRPNSVVAAQVTPMDKERKRKERLNDIKLDLHHTLLDNLNLAALETASEKDLRAEINAISVEALEEKSIVLNRDDRQIIFQELYDEVTGLGPLEPLLKDEASARF